MQNSCDNKVLQNLKNPQFTYRMNIFLNLLISKAFIAYGPKNCVLSNCIRIGCNLFLMDNTLYCSLLTILLVINKRVKRENECDVTCIKGKL